MCQGDVVWFVGVGGVWGLTWWFWRVFEGGWRDLIWWFCGEGSLGLLVGKGVEGIG